MGFRARPGVPVGPRWLRLPADTGSTQSITKATRKATCKGQADLAHSFILREGQRRERGKERAKGEEEEEESMRSGYIPPHTHTHTKKR